MRTAQDAETSARARGSTGARAGTSAGPATPRGVVRRAGHGGGRRADPAPDGDPGSDRRADRPVDAGWGAAVRIQPEAAQNAPRLGHRAQGGGGGAAGGGAAVAGAGTKGEASALRMPAELTRAGRAAPSTDASAGAGTAADGAAARRGLLGRRAR